MNSQCNQKKRGLRAQKTVFDILKFSLAVRPRGHKQRKLNDHVYSFFCLFPLGLIIMLNFIISKVAY